MSPSRLRSSVRICRRICSLMRRMQTSCVRSFAVPVAYWEADVPRPSAGRGSSRSRSESTGAGVALRLSSASIANLARFTAAAVLRWSRSPSLKLTKPTGLPSSSSSSPKVPPQWLVISSTLLLSSPLPADARSAADMSSSPNTRATSASASSSSALGCSAGCGCASAGNGLSAGGRVLPAPVAIAVAAMGSRFALRLAGSWGALTPRARPALGGAGRGERPGAGRQGTAFRRLASPGKGGPGWQKKSCSFRRASGGKK